MTSPPCPSDEPFAEAQDYWHLSRLYVDLGAVKGRGLTPVEKNYLRGLLCGYSPNEMAAHLQVKSDSVRNTLSKGLYRYLEILLTQKALARQAEEALALELSGVRVESWGKVPRLLQQEGYALSPAEGERPQVDDPLPDPSDPPPSLPSALGPGWPEVQQCYGRELELAQLKTWVLEEHCRLITLLGMGGIGKTTVAIHLAQGLQGQFDAVVWRSLRNSPDPTECFQFLVTTLGGEVNETEDPLTALMQILHRQRCLLIVEDVQATFNSGELVGTYAEGYSIYGAFLRRVGEEAHQSCVVITSWEKPREVARLETPNGKVRTQPLKGLPTAAARQILTEQQLKDPDTWDELIRPYRGNPLALKVLATTIHDLFGGSVAEFLNQDTLFLGDLAYLIHCQLSRLSPFERAIVQQLAAEAVPITMAELKQRTPANHSWSEWLAAFESLSRRSILEKMHCRDTLQVSLQPMVRKYVLNQGVGG